MSDHKAVLLWSSGSTDTAGFVTTTTTDGGFQDSCERHGGENGGRAQARLCPASGKFRNLTGLKWMSDVKAFGTMHSGIANDDDVGGGVPGKVVTHDYIKGGPYTRMEHVMILDCAGYDYCRLYWQGKVHAYEGLAIDDALTVQNTNVVFADVVRIAAAGMPAIDSSDGMFSIPKMMRLNENDSLASEGQATANPTNLTTDKSPGSGNPRGVPWMYGALTVDVGAGAEGSNWEPDSWVQGAGMLWTQYRGLYPGTDRWWMHEQVRPAMGFETPDAGQSTGSIQNASGPPGMFQWGKVYANTAKATTRYKFTKAGDKLEWSCWLGYPNHALLTTVASAGLTANNWSGQAVPHLQITGLARIALVVGAIGVPFAGAIAGDFAYSPTWSQVAPNNNTYLTSTPVGGAAAPREHVKGRLWAVLSSDRGRSW